MSESKMPRCPYCGSEMNAWNPELGMSPSGQPVYWYTCPECRALSPLCHDADAARRAANRRVLPPQVPMTAPNVEALDALEDMMPVWLEERRSSGADRLRPGLFGEISTNVNGDRIAQIVAQTNRGICIRQYCPMSLYGTLWRVWARKPNDAERKSAAWGQQDG